MKQLSVLFFAFCFFSQAFAQKPTLSSDFSLDISQRYTEIKAGATYNFGYNQDVLLIKKGKDHLTLQRFKLDGLKKSAQQSQIIEDKGKFVGMLQMEDYVFVFYSTGNKLSAMKISIISKVVQPAKTIINSKSNVAENFGFESTFGFSSEGRIHKFAVKKSFDGSKFLVQYLLQPGLLADKNTKDIVVVGVFDASLQRLWNQQITLPYPSLKTQKIDFAIDATGNHYMLLKVLKDFPKNDLDAVKELQDYHVEVLKTVINTGTAQNHKIEIGLNAVEEMVLHPDAKGTMSVFGFYKENHEAVKALGVFSSLLSEDGAPAELKVTAIDTAYTNKLDANRLTRIDKGDQDKDDKYDLENLKINKVLPNSDGSFVVLAEQRYVNERYMTTATGIRPVYTYLYRDVLTYKMNNDGTLAWFKKLPKHQISIKGKRSLSYTYMRGGGSYYLLFLDDFKNLRLSLDGFAYKFFDGKGGYLYVMAYKINEETGETEKIAVINTKDIKGLKLNRFFMDKIIRLSDTNLVIEGFDNKKKNFLMKLSVKK